jgi:putative oxidoreductase
MNSTFTKILRIVLGLGLLVFGLNKFIGFLPPPEIPQEASNFMESLRATGYVLYVLGGLEVLIGLLLVFRKWVAFALLLLVPISFNILLFHLFLDMPDILQALVIVVLNVILIYKYWKAYRPLFIY